MYENQNVIADFTEFSLCTTFPITSIQSTTKCSSFFKLNSKMYF